MTEGEEEEMETLTPFLSIYRDDDTSIPIYFQEDWHQGIGGGLWSTGLALSKYLTSPHAAANIQKISSRKKDDGISVLELGSGNGLLSVCLLALAKQLEEKSSPIIKDLAVTDLADHLPLIQKTLDANQHLINSLASTNVHVFEHNWGKWEHFDETSTSSFCQRVQSGQHQFDLIIGSDVAYHSSLYDILIASLQQFAHANTTILIGVTMNDTDPTFFHKLRRAGFHYNKFADHLLHKDFRGMTFGIFVIQKRERQE